MTQDTPSGKVLTKVQSVKQDFKRELEVGLNRFNRYSDKSRASPPDFNPGDMVSLLSKNTKFSRPTKKLSERLLGRIPILKKFGTHVYQLKLPSQCQSIFPVFHISLLEPLKTTKISNRNQEPPPIIVEEEEWEVAQILDSKFQRGNLWYLVEWKGFSSDPERSTWEPAETPNNFTELVNDSHSLYTENPGPYSSRALFFMVLGGERS
ncbi:hypothetical protein O181_008651 [Austropuccinia psidii MF-1]|uniref:Chromo domain-containing protein n=1 Tax=Austropuccinia psidii MF-1 TaxID=1389203 RepID=A0A9Q3BQ96_9BASI|nr:hypothetical protein [Austropuccinia psidii MF-1]